MKGKVVIPKELKKIAKDFFGITKNNVSQDDLDKITQVYIKWEISTDAAEYIGVSRQRFNVLMKDHHITPKSFGERIHYWKISDLDMVASRIKIEHRQN